MVTQVRSRRRLRESGGAFAAVCKDGTMVTWGNKNVGGDPSSVQAALIGVKRSLCHKECVYCSIE